MSYDLTLQRGEADEGDWPPLDETAVRAAIQALGDGVEDAGEEVYWQPAGLTAVFYLLEEPLRQLGVELHAGSEESMRQDARRLLGALVELAESQQASLHDPQCGDYVRADNIEQSLDCFAGPREQPPGG